LRVPPGDEGEHRQEHAESDRQLDEELGHPGQHDTGAPGGHRAPVKQSNSRDLQNCIRTCKERLTFKWTRPPNVTTLVTMSGQSTQPRDLTRSWRRVSTALAWVAIAGAGAALAVPGPTGELSGIAAIMAVAGLAVLAGHAWGQMVSGAASLMLLANVWPIVSSAQHSGWGAVAGGSAVAFAFPGAVAFALTLPRRLPALLASRVGRARPLGLPGSVAASAALLTLLVALPTVSGELGALTADPAAPKLASAGGATAPAPRPASADRDAQAVLPGAAQPGDLDVDDRLAAAGPAPLQGEAKAIADDPADLREDGALGADDALDLPGALGPEGDDEAGG